VNIPQYCIKHPVTTYMVSLLVILLGVISLFRLPQELYPPITFPEVSVVTNYLNAAPEEIETLITRPIEEAVGSVGGLKNIRSVSREGASVVTCAFHWGTNIDFAALELREKIDLVKERLPNEADEPVVVKFNPLDRPIMILSLTGDVNPVELRDVAIKKVKDDIEKVPGVASASVSGGQQREIVVDIDQGRLQAASTSLLQVVEALRNTNYNYPAGTITGGMYEFLLRTTGEFKGIKDIKDTVISVESMQQSEYERQRRQYIESAEEDQIRQTTEEARRAEARPSLEKRLVSLGDLGVIEDTVKKKTSISRYNGKPNVSISIQKQASSNTIAVCEVIRKKLEEVKKELPNSVNISLIYDHSDFIKKAVNGTRDDALQGAVLAFGALYLILKSISASVIVVVAIPIAIMGTFLFMFLGGMSLNTMTLGGLALGVGMMIDNGVVTVENIFRHRQMGQSSKEAAVAATNEVFSSQVGSTLTNVAVFIPLILFVPGVAGQLFKELSWTIIIAQLMSLLVAISLTPLLATHLKTKKKLDVSDDETAKLTYSRLPEEKKNKLIHRILGGAFALFIVALLLVPFLKVELLPKVDQGQFLVRIFMPAGTILDRTDEVVSLIEKRIQKIKEVDNTAVSIGSDRTRTAEGGVIEILGANQGQILVNLKKKRRRSAQDVVQMVRKEVERIELGNARIEYIVQESEFQFAAGGGAPIVIEIKGYSMIQMNRLVKALKKELGLIRSLYNIKDDRGESKPETKVEIDKEKAALYGVSVNEISLTAKVAVDGLVATTLKEGSRDIDIRVQLRQQDRAGISNIADLLVFAPALRQNILLSQTARLVKGQGPTEIKRADQERAVLVTADIESGTSKKKAVKAVEKLIKKTTIPTDFSMKLVGEKEEVQDAFSKLMFALLLAVVLVYMIMASQFESFVQPFIIMFTVPLSLIGVVVMLLITGTPLSVIALLGVIILGGVVVNNGILLIDFTNRKKRDMPGDEAAETAARVRFRPILMSAFTTIIGVVPLALGLGEGAELRAPMARAVMGGLITSTFLTLFVIPSLYVVNERMIHGGRSMVMRQVKGFLKFNISLFSDLFRQLRKDPRHFSTHFNQSKQRVKEAVQPLVSAVDDGLKAIVPFLNRMIAHLPKFLRETFRGDEDKEDKGPSA